jgi:YD repeat-containing protein
MDDSSAEALPTDDPTTRIEYDLSSWMTDRTPTYVRSFVRERHGAANPRWQESYTFSDGSGREVLKKIQAEPHPDQFADTRWIGTGRTIYDNKGNAVKKYEPYFSASPAWETESAIVESGVTPICHYDPVGRLVRTDLPNGTFSTVEFHAWQQVTWDENDTVLSSTWYTSRQRSDWQRDPFRASHPHHSPGTLPLLESRPASGHARTFDVCGFR